MFKNIKIDSMQSWNGEIIDFDPDSSPKAWEHYKQYYAFSNYNFGNLFFYNYYKDIGDPCGYKSNGKWLNYVNKPKGKNNRLYSLGKNTIIVNDFCEAADRLGGETDFNFNEQKVKLFTDIIKSDQNALNKQDALEQLERCANNHHTLLNFSLMQSMGNLQGHKGLNRFDRFDVFIYDLDRYFRGVSSEILNSSSDDNRRYLIAFLNQYIDIYAYMQKTYFIKNISLINKIIEQGAMPIEEAKDVVRYMSLAEEFWNEKEFYYLKKEFLTIEKYFNNGDKYTIKELLNMLTNDFGYSEDEGNNLISKCVERGFIIDCGNNLYTR